MIATGREDRLVATLKKRMRQGKALSSHDSTIAASKFCVSMSFHCLPCPGAVYVQICSRYPNMAFTVSGQGQMASRHIGVIEVLE